MGLVSCRSWSKDGSRRPQHGAKIFQMASRSPKTPQDDFERASRGSKMAPKVVPSPPCLFKNPYFYHGKFTFLDISSSRPLCGSRWRHAGPNLALRGLAKPQDGFKSTLEA